MINADAARISKINLLAEAYAPVTPQDIRWIAHKAKFYEAAARRSDASYDLLLRVVVESESKRSQVLEENERLKKELAVALQERDAAMRGEKTK